MAELLKIIELGCPALRRVASEVEDIRSAEIQDLIDGLLATLVDSGGVGLAAPQVDMSLRLFIVDPGPHGKGPGENREGPIVMINPEITAHSPDTAKDWEGCLSIPGIRGLVPRFTSITLRYSDRDGKVGEREFHGFSARICQHEYDHLEGLTYLDRLESVRDIVSETCRHAFTAELTAD